MVTINRYNDQLKNEILELIIDEGPQRFSEIKKEFDIDNNNTLNQQLTSLQNLRVIKKDLIDGHKKYVLDFKDLENLPDPYSKEVESCIDFLRKNNYLEMDGKNKKKISLDEDAITELIEFVEDNCEIIGKGIDINFNGKMTPLNTGQVMVLIDQILTATDDMEVNMKDGVSVCYEGNALSLMTINDPEEFRKSVKIQRNLEDGEYLKIYRTDESQVCSKCGEEIKPEETAWYVDNRDFNMTGIVCESCSDKVKIQEGLQSMG